MDVESVRNSLPKGTILVELTEPMKGLKVGKKSVRFGPQSFSMLGKLITAIHVLKEAVRKQVPDQEPQVLVALYEDRTWIYACPAETEIMVALDDRNYQLSELNTTVI